MGSLPAAPPPNKEMLTRFQRIRRATEALCEPLLVEDYGVQPMLEASPPKWHLGHTTWFFEALVLRPFVPGYRAYDPDYDYVFNSYYKSAGPHLDRSKRGLLCRPTTNEIRNYRHHIDAALQEAFETLSEDNLARMLRVFEIGLHHEQQHQELLLTDIKAILWSNPLRPTYRLSPAKLRPNDTESAKGDQWVEVPGGIQEIGAPEGETFSYDNERPRHRVWIEPFSLATRLVTNAEYLDFIEAGAYTNPLLWLSDGWDAAQRLGWQAPHYWERHGSGWQIFTLSGMQKLDPSEPVTHVSYYEADAFARWKGARLPTEPEWEIVASGTRVEGNFAESGIYHPVSAVGATPQGHGSFQLWGDVWEWCASSYLPYPGFKPLEGTLGEYNGKFMINQMILRGGSCATPRSHIRASYRNYFDPAARWQFSGFRMAR